MINHQLIHPKSIVIVGGSNNLQKPGGKVLKNILAGQFNGDLYALNPKEEEVQGIKSYRTADALPPVDLAIIAVSAKWCPDIVRLLAEKKHTRAFIILSAGFSEESEAGARLEMEIRKTVDNVQGSLIGPNCIGLMNPYYNGIFTTPIPKMDPKGVDFISGSGATAVFIIESGMPKGLTFANIFSVGNGAQMGVEEIIKYMDEHFDPLKSSKVKLLYIESIKEPRKLLKHTRSLVRKGCKIAAIKAGSSEAGSRAASSHTGALSSSDMAVDALFQKAGMVRCHSREELTNVASIFMYPPLEGKNMAIITHAGGPAVMLTDTLSHNGLNVPPLHLMNRKKMLKNLLPGSSAANPIDFLATGKAEHLEKIIDLCNDQLDDIDGMAVIFGSSGLFPVYEVYDVLDKKMKEAKKPIYPILPSVINAKEEITHFIRKGRIIFPDEVLFGQALAKVYHADTPLSASAYLPEIDTQAIRNILEDAPNGYLAPENVNLLLDAAGIHRTEEARVTSRQEAMKAADHLGYPVVMKVAGLLHKSDVDGVALNISGRKTVAETFDRLMAVQNATGIFIQPMIKGKEIFVGAKKENTFGHLILCGLGGIFVEVMKDISYSLSPVDRETATKMIHRLKSYRIIKGIRGQAGVHEKMFAETITRISALVEQAPQITELDINPLMGNEKRVIAVDTTIKIEK